MFNPVDGVVAAYAVRTTFKQALNLVLIEVELWSGVGSEELTRVSTSARCTASAAQAVSHLGKSTIKGI